MIYDSCVLYEPTIRLYDLIEKIHSCLWRTPPSLKAAASAQNTVLHTVGTAKASRPACGELSSRLRRLEVLQRPGDFRLEMAGGARGTAPLRGTPPSWGAGLPAEGRRAGTGGGRGEAG